MIRSAVGLWLDGDLVKKWVFWLVDTSGLQGLALQGINSIFLFQKLTLLTLFLRGLSGQLHNILI